MDGPNLWLLNLDQDLVNTLRVNFPEWNFGSSAVVTAVTEDLNNNNTTSTNTIIVETQRKTATRRQQQRKSSESRSPRKNYSKSSSISSNDKKMAEGKCTTQSTTINDNLSLKVSFEIFFLHLFDKRLILS